MNPPDLRRLRELGQTWEDEDTFVGLDRADLHFVMDSLPALIECVEALERLVGDLEEDGCLDEPADLDEAMDVLARLHHPVEERNDKQG